MLLEATSSGITGSIISIIIVVLFWAICILAIRKYILYKKHQSELLEEQNKLLKKIAEKDR